MRSRHTPACAQTVPSARTGDRIPCLRCALFQRRHCTRLIAAHSAVDCCAWTAQGQTVSTRQPGMKRSVDNLMLSHKPTKIINVGMSGCGKTLMANDFIRASKYDYYFVFD